MPQLFDRDNPVSEELAVVDHLATLLSTQTYFKELCETTDAAVALAKIKLAVADEPSDGLQFNIDELANEHFNARIYRVEGSHVVQPGGFDRPNEQGDLGVLLRRYVRESEDKQDAFLFFWDRTSRLIRDLQLAIETLTCPRILSITEPAGPWRGSYETSSAQGEYCWTQFVVKWGDAIEE